MRYLVCRLALILLICSGVTLSLAGCAGGTTITSVGLTPGASTNLSGNWLLAGALPASTSITPSAISVTATFDVNGNNVTGIVQALVPCLTIGAIGSPIIVSGTVAADGSFTLSNVVIAGIASTQAFTLQGKIPAAAGGTWAGNYSFTNSGSACAGVTNGVVAASPIALVAGTFSGTASLGNQGTALSQATPIKVTLQQGGPVNVANSPSSNLPLSGTIAVSSNCITSGTSTGAPIAGFVEGSQAGAMFLMNDGSTVLLDGQITAQDSSRLSVQMFTTNVGTCNQGFNNSSASPIQLLK
jgi:hypothetical protein